MLKLYYLKIMQWGGIIVGVILLLFKVRQSGMVAQQQKEVMETLKDVQTRNNIETIISNSDVDNLERLRKKWTK